MEQMIIHTQGAPEPIGPYVQARRVGDFLFTSGQIGMDPASGSIVGDDVRSQTRRVLHNLEAVLNAAGCGRDSVVKTTVFLKNMNDFPDFNEIYAEFFGGHQPARSCVEAARLPVDVLVEIECIAAVSGY